MAKATQTTTTTTRRGRRRKGSGKTSGGYIQCNMCKGTGRIKNWRKGKGK